MAKKLLVVEDDKFLSNAYKIKFTKAGFEVVLVTDGQEALTALQTFTPDIILLDLMMPIKDGFAVLESIKKDGRLKNIPVIVASNLGQKEETERALGLGASDFIIKSDLSLESIIDKINKFTKTPTT